MDPVAPLPQAADLDPLPPLLAELHDAHPAPGASAAAAAAEAAVLPEGGDPKRARKGASQEIFGTLLAAAMVAQVSAPPAPPVPKEITQADAQAMAATAHGACSGRGVGGNAGVLGRQRTGIPSTF